jgi:hypothetical protein
MVFPQTTRPERFSVVLGYPDSYDDLQAVLARPDHIVVFCHLHKTAGTTLEHALRRHYGDRALRCHTAADRMAVLRDLREGPAADGGRLIYGHFAHALLDDLGKLGYRPRRNLFRLTFLRHPIRRAESLYSFMKLRDPLMTEDMAQFLARYRKNTAADFFGARAAPEAWLRDGIDFVGICESMEQSLALLFQMLDVPLNEVPSHNVNTSRTDRMAPDLVGQFLARFRSEMVLYEVARAALEQACAAHLTRAGVDTATVASQARATTIDTDLARNEDSFSLHATGVSLFASDPDLALGFFRKAIRINPAFSRRAGEFLRPRDPARLARLEAEVRSDIGDTGDPLIARMLALLAPELPPELCPDPPAPREGPDPEELALDTDAAQVARLHWAAFGRPPDAAEQDRWAAVLAEPDSGGADRLAEEFAATAAFADRFPAAGTEDFVCALYRHVLGREADAEGLAAWTRAIDGGALTRAGALRNFAESAEFRARVSRLARSL